MTDEPLFKSVHQALLFAHTFTPNQHAQAAAAERLISLFAKERYRDVPGEGGAVYRISPRGLVGLDGAAQAGMILAAVAQLPEIEREAIQARFNILKYPRMYCARREIAVHVCRAMGLNPRRGQWLVQGCYGANVRLTDRREELYPEWSQATFYRKYKEVKQMIRRIEDQAFERLADRFVKSGLCEAA